MNLKILIILSLIFISPAAGDAKKNYKYEDENGVWHFTDIAPITDQPVEVEQVYVKGPVRKVRAVNMGSTNEPDYYVENLYRGPVEAAFDLSEGENIMTVPSLPLNIVAPAMKKIKAFSLRAKNRKKGWSFRYSFSYVPGDPASKHSPDKPYRPPFGSGESFHISQAFGGEFSHNDGSNKYAVDITMPEGTPVHAARGGIIMDIAADFYTGGSDMEKFGERANIVRVLHDDGTMAVYAHLKLESVRYGMGRRVEEGDFIAESGNTGFSTGPHLHFVIQKNAGMKIVSLPFEFMGEGGRGVTPEKGMVLSLP